MNKLKIGAAALIAAAVCVAVGGFSVAQQQNSNSNMNGNMSGQNSNMNGNMNSGRMGQGMAGLSSQDRRFMMRAAMSDMNEIMSGRVALERAASDEVKRYAQQMIDDHTRMSDELKTLASAKGVTLPTDVSAKMRRDMAKLQTMSGAEFDRMYIRMAGDKAHRDTLKEFQRQIARGSDAETVAQAQKGEPIVRMHLEMAQTMMRGMMNMNGNMSGNMNSNMNRNMNRNMNMNGNMNSNMNGNTNSNMNTNNSNR